MRSPGEHVTFSKPGQGHISVPLVKGRKVKRYILIQICARLGLDEQE
jgi:hypothetical protein